MCAVTAAARLMTEALRTLRTTGEACPDDLRERRRGSVDVELVAFRVLHSDGVVVEPLFREGARDGGAQPR
jgi:hypothetical protein